MKTTLKTLAAASVLAVASLGTAHANGPQGYGYVTVQPGYGARHHPLDGLREINARQEQQRARIDHGFRTGLITRLEFRRLMAEQQDIQGMERAFVSDGFLHPRERMELHRRLDLASRHIVFEARDHQRRF